METYELRRIKEAGGDETPRFEALLFKNGNKVAIVYNEGCGGCHGYDFFKREEEDLFYAFAKEWGKANNETSEIEDAWVYEQMEAAKELKTLKRWSKTKTCFRTKDTEKGSWRQILRPYSEELEKHLVAKYGENLECIFKGGEIVKI